jgi:serine/threonine protein kinase
MRTVGRYEILREVGRGGMAMVYLARQSDLDRFVALKELGAFHASDPSFAQRFLRESRVAGSLSHPNIVTVHDYFQHDGTPYIAMEYVERGSLRPYVGRMTMAQIGGVLEGLLAGLAHGEQNGIVHRDLKPENLMVTADGRVKIADFGIAKATTKMQTGAFLTATGTTVGTPTYMAPEQAMAQDIGPWTDLYSVGCMAFELFTGRVPFHDSDAPMAILLRHVNEPIPAVKSIDPAVDQRISDWIERLLVKDPKQRTQSAADAWDDFEEIVIGLLGPRWRRQARLLDDVAQADTPKPLTPAPFEGTSADASVSDEFQSFAWGSSAAPDTGGAAAAPPGPYTPPPQPSAPAPPEPEVGPPTPPPGPAAPAPDQESGFVTFGAPAPPPPTDALIPPPAAPEAPAHETLPRADEPAPAPAPAEATSAPGFETYVAPPPLRPPTEEPPQDAPALPEPVAAEPAPPAAEPAEPATPAPSPVEPAAVEPPPPAPAEPSQPEVAATVMPEALRTPAEPAPAAPAREGGRRLFPVVVVAGVLVAAVAGFLAGGSGGGDEPEGGGPPVVPAANAAIKLKVPEGWTRMASAPEVPGLTLAGPVAYAPPGAANGEAVVFGSAGKDAANSTLLPNGVIQAAGEVPEGREAVELGPAGLQAYRYEDVRLSGLDAPVTFYAVPTTEGVATVACLGGGTSCEGIANTTELVSGEPFPVGPSADYADAAGGAMADLSRAVKRGQRTLNRSRLPATQAAAARDLWRAYRTASRALAGLELSPADRGANARLVAALGATAAAYDRAATAAANDSKAGFRKAGRSVEAAQEEVAGALEGLRAAGYEIES